MRVNIVAAPVLARENTSARMANRMDKNVVTTAASWGLFPKGAATKKDQLASEKPSKRWTTRIRPPLVSVKIL